MGERRPCKAEVVGSNPISSTRRSVEELGCAAPISGAATLRALVGAADPNDPEFFEN